MRIATFVMASLAFVTSAATLAIVLVGAKKVQNQVEDAKFTANARIETFLGAMRELKF